MTWKAKLGRLVAGAPLLAWLAGALVAVVLEHLVGDPLATLLGLPKIPVLFGAVIMLKTPVLIPSIVVYVTAIYLLPVSIVARLLRAGGNRLAAWLLLLSAGACPLSAGDKPRRCPCNVGMGHSSRRGHPRPRSLTHH